MSNVNFDFTGKKFVVTGASSGMGRQVALELANAGAIVLAIARRETELGKLKQEQPDNIFIAPLDVTDKIALDSAIKAFVEKNGKLNGAVHAAGILGLTPIKMYDEDYAREIMDISYWAAVNLMQIITKNKYSENATSSVLFSSAGGHNAAKGMFAYASAKAALQVLARSIAKEISQKRHRVNTISPGWVITNMTSNADKSTDADNIIKQHLLGEGQPSDVSGVVLFLLSDRARWITGTDIIVDGGYLA